MNEVKEPAAHRTPYDDPEAAPAFDERELSEPSALGPAERRRVVYAYHMIQDLTLYEQLGVDKCDDRRAIRDAYFSLSKLFHPDAYFGVELGAYRAKMEAVFKQLTEAYEILNRKAKRADYDAFLRASGRWRSTPPPAAEGDKGEGEMGAREPLAAAAVTPPPPPAPPPPRKPLAERRQLAAERMRRRFAGLQAPLAAAEPDASTAAPLESPLVALQRRLRESPLRAAAYMAQAVSAAQTAAQCGDHAAAERLVDHVLAHSPQHPQALALQAQLAAGRFRERGAVVRPGKRKP